MSVLDIADQGPGQNPRAPGVMSYGREGVPAGFTVDTEGNANFLGTVTSAGGGGGGVTVTTGRIVAGDANLPNTAGAWQLVAGFGGMSVPAVVGDQLLFIPSFMWDPIAAAQFLDLAIVVAAAAVRYASSGTGTPAVEGDPGMYAAPDTYRSSGGGMFDVTVGPADLDAGNVVFQMATRGNGVGPPVLFGSANFPFRWRCLNFGQ